MIDMQDSKGQQIPRDKDGDAYFSAFLHNYDDGKGPIFHVKMPSYFEDETGSIHDSKGCACVPIQDVLNEYVNILGDLRETELSNQEAELTKFVTWLRDYANRLEFASVKYPTPIF